MDTENISIEEMVEQNVAEVDAAEQEEEVVVEEPEAEEPPAEVETEKPADTEGSEDEEATEATEQEPAKEASEEPQALETATTEEPSEFKPDLNYTYRGKQFDMPEELAEVIKDEATLEKYREVFTKAAGLEVVKAKGKEFEEKFNGLADSVDSFYREMEMNNFGKAFELAQLKKPSLEDTLRGFGFSKDEVIRHAYDLANQTPEQTQASEAMHEIRRQNQQLQMQMEQMQLGYQAREQQNFQSEIDAVFTDPRVVEIGQAYNAKFGEGAFENEVRLRGSQIYTNENRVERPAKLVNDFISRYNLGSLVESKPAEPSQNMINTSQPARNNSKEVPVIPAVESGGGSPAQKEISSLDDIAREFKMEYGSDLSFY